MNIKNEFTEPECERFRRECNFTEDERAIFDLRVKDKTIIQIQEELSKQNRNMSEATINRRIKAIKRKIDKVM